MKSRLGIRSAYSLLSGVHRPEAIVARAADFGATSLAITDRDNLYGLHSFLDAARERRINPVIGAELRFGEGQGHEQPTGSIFAFVKDRDGFARLCEVLSRGTGGTRPDRLAALRENSRGLVLASTSPGLLATLAGKVPALYAALTPASLHALGAAKALGLPLLALDDASLLEKEDLAAHRLLRAIALGTTVGALPEGDEGMGEGIFLPPEAFSRRLASWPEAFRAADEVAAACTFGSVFNGLVFPDYPGAAGGDPAEELRRRALAGAERRYGEVSDAILGRLEYELDIIRRKGFSAYFLVMDDIVAMASRTCGRGSGAASLVAYSLGVTNVDPIAHNLYFERFLNEARDDPPDIDVDFAWDERDALIRRVISAFGEERCARVANHNLFRPRSAFREAAKAYGYSEGEASAAARRVFDFSEGASSLDPPWPEIARLAGRIEGLPRGLSMHCGGLVVAPGPIDRYAPIERSAEDYPLLAWEKEGTEAAGLVKLDLLGNRSLAVIRDALANLEEEGIHMDPDLWRPAEDPETIAALAKGDSLGVFYIESPAMRRLQVKTGRGDFEHIVIHSSIIRPAANRFIGEYVRRLKGAPWRNIHPRLDGVLDETYGILCYQEDVSKTAIALAGFDESEADRLRKIIAKKADGERLAAWKERFFRGCLAKGVDETAATEAWDMMLSFDGYSFCKPHSASYAMVSFQSAWLRVHFPAAFMAAVLSNQGGYYRPQAYISEARRMGLGVLGPDLNLSRRNYYSFKNAVVIGFMSVAGLSLSAIEAIEGERLRNGPFRSLDEIVSRLDLARDDLIALVAAGAFDSLAGGLARSLQARLLLVSRGGGDRADGGQKSLFADSRPGQPPPPKASPPRQTPRPPPPPIPGASRTEAELWQEFSALGYLRDRHPLSLWERDIAPIERIMARDLGAHLGRRVRLIGWPVTQKEVLTLGGLAMNFLSLEDETALYDTVLFPEAYGRYRKLLLDQQPLIVEGIVKDEDGALGVELSRVLTLAGPTGAAGPPLSQPT